MTDILDQIPESPWHDDEVLADGLAIVYQGIAGFFDRLAELRQNSDAPPISAALFAALGSAMVDIGNALQSRIVNNLPDSLPAPPFPRES